MPRTRYALLQHLNKANLQTAVWRRAHDQNPEIHSPNSEGWNLTGNGQLEMICWMLNLVAPKYVLTAVACRCQKVKCFGRDFVHRFMHVHKL